MYLYRLREYQSHTHTRMHTQNIRASPPEALFTEALIHRVVSHPRRYCSAGQSKRELDVRCFSSTSVCGRRKVCVCVFKGVCQWGCRLLCCIQLLSYIQCHYPLLGGSTAPYLCALLLCLNTCELFSRKMSQNPTSD